ncbi:hypothetical protein [Nostoc sp. UHCC 0252]|nr:hypothetical protein [Nostoc sp. UHCC 0252]MEA5605192.1 hypothetical protein [Nostoc sp. UHCC 0252]
MSESESFGKQICDSKQLENITNWTKLQVNFICLILLGSERMRDRLTL